MANQLGLYQKVLETFTDDAKQALVVAQEKAHEAELNYVGTEHLLIGILSQYGSSGWDILTRSGASLYNVDLALKTERREPQVMSNEEFSGLSDSAKQAVEGAILCAHDFGHTSVGTTHLLFALCSQEETAFTVMLENMKVNLHDLKKEVVLVLKNNSDGGATSPTLVHTTPPGTGGAAAAMAEHHSHLKEFFTLHKTKWLAG